MAAGNSQTKLMDEIQDSFLLCKICFEIYRRPKTLICLHVFCEECLEKTADAEFERSYRYMLYTRTVKCPICRKKTELPGGGVRRLPDNFLVANLADVLSRKKTSGAAPSCEICKPNGANSNNVAVSKCLDCCKLLCKSCVDLHRRTKVTASHGLYDVEVEKDVECKIHPDEVVRFYCEPCELCICVVCTFQEHKGHDVSSFTEGMEKYANSLDTLLSACKERMTSLREQVHLIESCERDMKLTEDHIRDVAIDSIGAVRKKEKDMLARLQQTYSPDISDFLRSKDDLQDALENIQSTCSLTEIILKDKSIELLLLKKEIQQKLEGMLSNTVMATPKKITQQVRFVPGSLTFGYLDVDGSGKPEEYGDYQQVPSLKPSESVDVQTDKMDITESATTMDQLQKDYSSPKITQTDQVKSLEKATSPVPNDTKTESTMALPETRESCTMTPCTPTMRRRVQTVPIPSADQGTATVHMDTSHKFTNTLGSITTERSTLTKRMSFIDEVTDTGGLVVCRDQQTTTPITMIRSAGTLTDLVRHISQSTTTIGPDLKDKMTSTPKLSQLTRETMTPLITMLDMGITAKILGTDRACATKTTITSDSFVRGTDVRTRDQQSETPWDRTLRLTVEKGTMPALQMADKGMRTEHCESHDIDTYTNHFNMTDKTMETDSVERKEVSTGTLTRELAHKGTETAKRKTSDKGIHVQEKLAKMETKSCTTQTAIQLQHYIPEPNTTPCNQETNTAVLEQNSQETSTIHVQLVDMGTGSQSVDITDTGVGDSNVCTSTAQINTVKAMTATRGMVTTKFINPSKQTNTAVVDTSEVSMETVKTDTKDGYNDAFKGNVRDAHSNTDLDVIVKSRVVMSDVGTSPPEATVLQDKAVGTALVTVSHKGTAMQISTATLATNTEVQQRQDAQTTMSSRVQTSEADTGMPRVETSDSGCGAPPVVALSTGTETNQITLKDSEMCTTQVITESRGVGSNITTAERSTDMPRAEFSDTGVDTEPKVMLEKLVGTATVELVDRGVGSVGKLMHTRSTDMPVVETRSVETHTHVPSVEKATYMPHTVTITTGTSTVGVQMANKKVNTPQKDILDSGTMTVCKKYVDQDTTMQRNVMCSDTYTSTRQISLKDTASDAVVTPRRSYSTNTPVIQVSDVDTNTKQIVTLSASTSTQHRVTTSDQLSGTPHVTQVDKETPSLIGPSTDCSTMTHIESRSVGVLKRPDAVSRGMITSRVKSVESYTEMKAPYTKESTSMTDVTETADIGITSKPIGLVTRGTGTPSRTQTETGTSMAITETTARASSPIRSNIQERGCSPLAGQLTQRASSPVKFPTANKKIGVKAKTTESYTTTPRVESKDQATGESRVSVSDRQCSPVCFEEDKPKSTDMGTSMAHLVTTERETSPLRPFTKDSFTATTRIRLTDSGSSPIRIPTRSCGVHVGVVMETKEAGTPTVFTSEVGTEMPKIYLSDSGTSTMRVSQSEKETSTRPVYLRHKNVSTDSVITMDASTPAPVDIMAAYLEAIRPPKPVTVTRGTGTELVVTETKELSPIRWLSADKASSPLRILKCDKAVSVRGKGEIMEPVDRFHKAGGSRTRRARPVADSSKPKLACITEDMEKASSEDEDGFPSSAPTALPSLPSFPRHRLRPRPSLFAEAKPVMRSGGFGTSRAVGAGLGASCPGSIGGGITHTERLWPSSPRLGLAAQRALTPSGQSSFTGETGRGSPILMKVEMGTNTSDVTTETRGTSTPPIDRHDKAMCTESVTVDGKMAACISKLKTVRQRLEQSPVYSQAGSTADTPRMALSPPIQSTVAAKTSPRLLHVRSRSLSEGLDESDSSPFASPQTLRKANAVLESQSESSDSEKAGGIPAAPQSPRTRQALARKQRLDLSQMLRSASMPERDHPPFSPLPKPQIHHTRVIPPLDIGPCKPPGSLRKPKPRKPTRSFPTFAQTPELDEEEERAHSDDVAIEKSKKETHREKLQHQLPFEERRAIGRALLHPHSDSGSSSGSDSSGNKSPSHFRPLRQIPKPRATRETKLTSTLKSLKEEKK